MQIAKIFSKHHVSLSEVARRMGISKGTLSDAIRRDNMHTDTLRRIAKAAGCNVSEFFADEDKQKEETPPAVLKSNFTVMLECNGQIYRADNAKELEAIVTKLQQTKNIGALTKSMSTKITTTTFRYLEDVKEYMHVLCKKYGITDAYGTSLPESFEHNHQWGIIYAADADKNILAASPFWKNRNGLYEVQNELVRVGNMTLQKRFKVFPFKKSFSDFEICSKLNSKDKGKKMPSKIALMIKERGLTVTEVAKRMGVFPTSLSRIIHNGTNRQSTLKSIAEAIGCNIEDLKD